MKNNEFQKGIKDIAGIKLTSDERSDLFARLDGYVTDHPVLAMPKVSPWTRLFIQYRHSYVGGALLICLFVGTTLTYAAEGALPGDVLYPVKIYVNEPVKAAVRVTPKAKAEFEEERIIKRVDEVEALVKQGKFDDKKRTLIEKEVEKTAHAIKVNRGKRRDGDNDQKGVTIIQPQATTTITDFEAKLDSRLGNLRNAEVKIDKKQNEEIEKFEIKIKNQLGNFNSSRDDSHEINVKVPSLLR